MSTPKEIEIKLELSPATLPRLKKIPLLRTPKGATRRSAEVSVYFDTDKHKLRKKGLILRVRRIGNRYIQTIKATGRSSSPSTAARSPPEIAQRPCVKSSSSSSEGARRISSTLHAS